MTLHYNYTYTTLHYTTLDLQYATRQYTALHYTNYTTLQLQRIYTTHHKMFSIGPYQGMKNHEDHEHYGLDFVVSISPKDSGQPVRLHGTS